MFNRARVTSIVLPMVVVILSACSGMSLEDNQRFQSEVARLVSVGMPINAAQRNLENAGFRCEERHIAPDFTCTRERGGAVIYSCTQRVNLMLDADRQTVKEAIPKPIACVGGF